MIPTTKTPRTTSAMDSSSQHSQIDASNNSASASVVKSNRERRINMTGDTRSVPCTPTGPRHCVDAYNWDVPIALRRRSSFGSDALSCSSHTATTNCYSDNVILRSVSSSSSSSVSVTDSSSLECTTTNNNSINNTRSVNLYDLIDEEFVVNCGAFGGSRASVEERTSVRRNSSSSSSSSSRPQLRRRKSILDMIDRIGTTPEDDKKMDNDNLDSSVMTTRSYPRGVYVVPPRGERETMAAVGNTVAFVSAEAYNQW